jgi:hypothetical protein
LTGASAQTQFMLCDEIGSSTAYGVNGYIEFNKVNTSTFPFINYRFYTESEQTVVGAGFNYTSRTYTGFLLKASSGNVSGTISIYGLAK